MGDNACSAQVVATVDQVQCVQQRLTATLRLVDVSLRAKLDVAQDMDNGYESLFTPTANARNTHTHRPGGGPTQ